MRKIDNATVQRILDAADIVEVVSDFVALKRRGANYVGLCPFHNDRSPSFYVSKAKGMCKCFSCGEGGSPVSFIMKLEQLSFTEALRYLAKKYNIEIEEREMTDEEQQAETDRENMLAVNDFAMRYFEKNLKETQEGRDIGLSYFRYRGISDAMVERFHLGYAVEGRDALFATALERGYSEKYLLSTGLCSRTDDGRVFDRFRGRVIYPILSLSGTVVAFGGRTLSKEKKIAKYVNSPESDIYLKRRELYGLYQAKQAIAKAQKCILVEGYMDVISMHQAGVCNVVASSGTALTVEQVRLIKRFTSNVTLIYDSDAAGIKASLRGIELLLQDGMDIKVLLLPEGDDPDSFAQSHSSTEVEEYIKAHETDFISFMARILMGEAADDPARRAQVITRIVKTIALIPDEITRRVYVQECSRLLFMDEDVLRREVGKYYNEYRLKSREDRERRQAFADYADEPGPGPASAEEQTAAGVAGQQPQAQVSAQGKHAKFLRTYELAIVRLVAKYGNYAFAEGIDEDGNNQPMTVLEYIEADLAADEIRFENSDIAHFLDMAIVLSRATWNEDIEHCRVQLEERRRSEFAAGVEEIRRKATDVGSISAMERSLQETVDADYARRLDEFAATYLGRLMCSSPDDVVREMASDLVVERHILSKMHTKYAKVDTEQDLLGELVPRALHELKDAILWTRLQDVRSLLAACGGDYDRSIELMKEMKEIENSRSELAKLIGDRVIVPRK
ncbi:MULTISPECIES: DNA primase [Duncaniella]|jgi:DNA primase|nr:MULTISPECIES: DNA primase [Duncaniella]QCD38949.1 DNA primase [Duncaniella sp. C9]QCP72639.1 DNA primase [Duncaniella sp. B8]